MIDVEKYELVQQIVFAVDNGVFEPHEINYFRTSNYYDQMADEIRSMKNRSIKLEYEFRD